VRHFIEVCPDETLANLKFIIVDTVNNTDNLTKSDVDSLLLEKENQGLNGSHDWSRKNRSEREKIM